MAANTAATSKAILERCAAHPTRSAASAAYPSSSRLLFYRKYYYRQSTAQIAVELGTTERAVEGRLYRIKKALRKALGGDDA